MNMYVYFSMRSDSFPSIQPEHRQWFEQAWGKLASKNRSKPEREALLEPVVQELSLPDQKDTPNKDGFDGRLKSVAFDWRREFADLPVFAFCWIGLYQGIWIHVIEALLEMKPVSSQMSISVGTIWIMLVAYGVFKGLLYVMSMRLAGITRWLWIGALFLIFIGGMYLERFMGTGIMVPLWMVLVVLGLPAWFAHVWNREVLLRPV